ncbi:MAG: hypothetical protein U1F77_12365 [Kiritimatiellia bacterium]
MMWLYSVSAGLHCADLSAGQQGGQAVLLGHLQEMGEQAAGAQGISPRIRCVSL